MDTVPYQALPLLRFFACGKKWERERGSLEMRLMICLDVLGSGATVWDRHFYQERKPSWCGWIDHFWREDELSIANGDLQAMSMHAPVWIRPGTILFHCQWCCEKLRFVTWLKYRQSHTEVSSYCNNCKCRQKTSVKKSECHQQVNSDSDSVVFYLNYEWPA